MRMKALVDKAIKMNDYGTRFKIEKIDKKSLVSYDGDTDVIAIAGSRAMAAIAADMELPSLKLFQLTSAGYDNVPLEKYSKRGVMICNAGDIYSIPIAETVIYGILQMAKKYRKNPKKHLLRLTRGYRYITELAKKTVLIMGTGNIGTHVANRLKGFNCDIIGYDPYCKDKEPFRKILRDISELKEALKRSDYIVTTLPDNPETRGFINQELLGCMKASAVIVNVGRKAIFNSDDLYRALKEKQIGGAVLDMFEVFPNPFTNKFRRLSNVIVLPGVAAISQEVNERRKNFILSNLSAISQGEVPGNIINKVEKNVF